MGVFSAPCQQGLRPRLHEQIKHALFVQILAELLHTDPKFEQILPTLFAHVSPVLATKMFYTNTAVNVREYLKQTCNNRLDSHAKYVTKERQN